MENSAWVSSSLALSANFVLGASSIYWAVFDNVNPIEIVAYRILFSLIVLLLFLFLFKKLMKLFQSVSLHEIYLHSFASILVSINWGTFILASLNQTVLESGFGYLVAPVFTIIVGSIFLNEKLSKNKMILVLGILLTISILIVSSGKLQHWVYLTIAVTWGGYTVIKKITTLNSIEGLFLETIFLSTMLLLGIAVGFLEFIDLSLDRVNSMPLLVTTGIVSVIPLIMFSAAAQNLSSYVMGLFQFTLPTVQLVVSYLYFGQIATPLTYVCFSIIWLLLFFGSMRMPPIYVSHRLFEGGAEKRD